MTIIRQSLILPLLLVITLVGERTSLAEPPLSGAVIVVDPGHGGQRYSKSYTAERGESRPA